MAGIIGAALAAAGDAGVRSMDQNINQLNDLEKQKAASDQQMKNSLTLLAAQKQAAIDSANQLREGQASRIKGALPSVVQGQIDSKYADANDAEAGLNSAALTPEQLAVIAQSKNADRAELASDPQSYVKAAMLTGDISPHEVAQLAQQEASYRRQEAATDKQFAHIDKAQERQFAQQNESQERSLRLQAELQERSLASAERRADKRDQATANKPPPGYRWKAPGELEAIPGGPIDSKTTPMQQKISDAKDVISLLDMAGGLIDKATSSYGGVAVDQAARVFGKSTEGASAAAQLNALEGMLISKMPKMSGPQSDKDVAMYRQMAGRIGDNTVPVEQKKAAAEIIRQINEKYLDDVGVNFKAPTQYGKKPSAPTPFAKPDAGIPDDIQGLLNKYGH